MPEKFCPKELAARRIMNVDIFDQMNEENLLLIYLPLIQGIIDSHKGLLESKQVINGKPVKEHTHYQEYKTELQEFFKKHQILNPKAVSKSMGISIQEYHARFKNENLENINPKNIIRELIQTYKNRKDDSYEFNLILEKELTHRIQNTGDTFIKVHTHLKGVKDDVIKRFMLIYAYVMLFESIKDLYTPIYIKLTGNTTEQGRVKRMVDFFKIKYPSLSRNLDYNLRNDAAHILYEYRHKYTTAELEKTTLELFLEISAYVVVVYEDFSSAMEKVSKQLLDFEERMANLKEKNEKAKKSY